MRKLVILVVVVALVAVASGGVVTAGPARTVKTKGGEQFVPNAMLLGNIKFAPGPITVNSGDTATWEHADRTEDPHIITIVNEADLPTTVQEVLFCPLCGVTIGEHFPDGAPVFVREDDDDTEFGLDGVGDSLLIFDNESISAEITAPADTTLFYLCAIHPWMQGSIRVKG